MRVLTSVLYSEFGAWTDKETRLSIAALSASCHDGKAFSCVNSLVSAHRLSILIRNVYAGLHFLLKLYIGLHSHYSQRQLNTLLHSDRPQDPPCLLSKEDRGLFPKDKGDQPEGDLSPLHPCTSL